MHIFWKDQTHQKRITSVKTQNPFLHIFWKDQTNRIQGQYYNISCQTFWRVGHDSSSKCPKLTCLFRQFLKLTWLFLQFLKLTWLFIQFLKLTWLFLQFLKLTWLFLRFLPFSAPPPPPLWTERGQRLCLASSLPQTPHALPWDIFKSLRLSTINS